MSGLGQRRRPQRLTGGTAFNPHFPLHKPSPKPSPLGAVDITPPDYTFDPAIEAQRRAAVRGLEDTEADVTTKRHFAHTNLREALHKQHRETGRGFQDIATKRGQGEQRLGNEEADLNRTAARKQQDFQAELQNIARSYTRLGQRQTEGANAAGVLDAGTQAASAAARARNQGLAEEPIHTGQQRVAEDLATALGRLGTARGELAKETARADIRLGQNSRFERRQAKRQTGQELFELFRKLQTARREENISQADLLAQEIYQARENHPGAFAQWAREHPGAATSAAAGLPSTGAGRPRNPGPRIGGNRQPPARRRRR